MKISEMNFDQASDVLIRLATPFENICNDEEFLKTLIQVSKMGQMPRIKVVGVIIPRLVSIGLKEHREDVLEIVAALSSSTPSKVAKMNVVDVIKTFVESYDEVANNFFPLFGLAGKNSEAESA